MTSGGKTTLASCFALLLLGCGAQGPVANTLPTSHSPIDPLTVTSPIEAFALPNGLRVVLNEDHRVPLVAVRVVYRTGFGADPPGQSGLSHLTEHLLFRGSRHAPDGTHFRALLDAGAGEVNGSTAADRTDFWELVPASQLPLALWLEADRMDSGLDGVTPATLDKERRIIERERNERIDASPNGRLYEFLSQALFPAGHPYRAPLVMGPDLAAVTVSDVREFHREQHAPGIGLLVLAGDFDSGAAKELVQHYFAPIAARPAPVPGPVGFVRLSEQRRLDIEARVDLGTVVLSWPTPPLFAPGDAELDVIARYLTQDRLATLVGKDHLALGAGARQHSASLTSTFEVAVDLRPGVPPERIIEAVDVALDELKQRGLAENSLRNMANGWLAATYLDSDDLLERSWMVAHSALFARDPHFMGQAIHRYRAVTNSAIREAAASYLPRFGRVVAVITPSASAPLAGRLLARP